VYQELVGKFAKIMTANRKNAAETSCGLQGWQVETVSSEDSIVAVPVTENPVAKSLKPGEHLGSTMLKGRYLRYFRGRADNAILLPDVVKDLLDERVPRRTLVAWVIESGYSKGYASSLLRRILVSLGPRERKPGVGRKPSLAALELLSYAHNRYGDEFLKVLRAALRAGKAQQAVANCPTEICSRSSDLIVGPQLEREPDRLYRKTIVNFVL
jgi:hypothetical protein